MSIEIATFTSNIGHVQYIGWKYQHTCTTFMLVNVCQISSTYYVVMLREMRFAMFWIALDVSFLLFLYRLTYLNDVLVPHAVELIYQICTGCSKEDAVADCCRLLQTAGIVH